ncbi:hypothetical protein RHGRI_005084 [Rhododendron griersonianum]|uniref:ATP-dependent DNA helicase n=1 Tax=Rhododendron griersonianum TaxID=479676 RepID=A0AAV6LAX0_9ERIC|nr:hypothetical protein RHGRI_005084 [Rhododendron griersonianum]
MSLCVPRAIELSKGKGKAIYVAKGKKSMLDGDLEKTVRFLREKNVGIMICDERELNQIRMHGEKAKAIAICGGKENAAPKAAPNDNVISKAQCLRCERGRAGECIQPRRPTFFPSLTPSRYRRACLERGMMATNSNQLTSTSIEIPAPKQAMVSHTFQSSSVVVLPKTPNLRDYSAITVDSMLCHHEPQARQHSISHIEESISMPSIIEESDSEMCHPSMPPRNLEQEFLAMATPPWNIDKELLTMLGTSLALIHRLPPENQSIDDELEEDESTNVGVDPQANRYLNRHYLGRMDVSCLHYTRVLNGRGPLSFTIHGELRHRIGSLLPQPGHEAIYSQLYKYDPESALNARNHRNPHLRRNVLKTIQDSLLAFNLFPDKFLRAFEILNQSESDSMAITQHNQHPDIFLTMTVNLNWSEIIEALLPHQKAVDRPDLVARVFELKRKCLMRMRCVKYIHKYIYKDNDRATMMLGLIDEIKEYLDAMYIGPIEAAWWLFGHSMHEEIPIVESGKNIKVFPPMPLPIGNWSVVVGNRLILEHQQLISDAQRSDANINVESLNEEQRAAYTAITTSVFENKGTTFFLNGGAGTGKIFLYNTVAMKCHSLGHVLVSVASSGIASLLLVGGCTAHSTFSFPLDVLEDSFCSFSKQSL